MKFMLMMHAPRGTGGLTPASELAAGGHQGAHRLHEALQQGARRRRASWSARRGSRRPDEARIVRAGKGGAPEVTDGPFAEAKEFLAGYWIVDVRHAGARLRDRGARVRGARARAATPMNMPIEVREVMSAPPSTRDATTPDVADEHLLRELAPQVLGAVVRRFGDFAAAEDAVQEALLAAADAVAARRRARQPARLADPRRRAAHDRSRPQRDRAPAARDGRGHERRRRRRRRAAAGSRQRRRIRTTRSILLFMCCHPALTPLVGDRADAARGRRPDDRRDRQRVPGARGDDGAADQPRQAEHQGVGRAVSRCRRATSARERLDAVLHVLYLIFNEGYASSSGPTLQRTRSVERGDPADARGAQLAARRRRGRGTAGADAADRRAPAARTGPTAS